MQALFSFKIPLFYKHYIAKRKKSVSFLHSLPVSLKHMLPSCKGADQHHQRGLWQVKIGNQAVQHFETVSGINEDFGISAACLQEPVFIRCAFHRSAACGSHTNHPAAASFCFINRLRRLSGYLIILGMHVMLQNILDLYRAESAKAHMKCHIGQLYPLFLYLM